ncbi:MAG TPA: lysophospholipid acyltransferase family protein [Usitatibacter sp.]|nr:lysophospholipid acyltransferase family protein [Usitatibacter sp.]
MGAHAAAAALILALVFPRVSPAARRRLVRWWSAKLVRIAGLRVEVAGLGPGHGEAAPAAQMLAANHISWIDIFVVMSVRPARFIAKSEIRDWPVAGWIADRAGTLFIRRARRHDTARINDRVHDALEQGDCVGLFPEGTTTDGAELLHFHTSLFEPAIANAATIHPAAIRYEHADGSRCTSVAYVGEMSFMESMAGVLGGRGVTARLSFAPPIAPAAGMDRRAAARIAHERIASLLGLSRAGTPPGRPPDRAAVLP